MFQRHVEARWEVKNLLFESALWTDSAPVLIMIAGGAAFLVSLDLGGTYVVAATTVSLLFTAWVISRLVRPRSLQWSEYPIVESEFGAIVCRSGHLVFGPVKHQLDGINLSMEPGLRPINIATTSRVVGQCSYPQQIQLHLNVPMASVEIEMDSEWFSFPILWIVDYEIEAELYRRLGRTEYRRRLFRIHESVERAGGFIPVSTDAPDQSPPHGIAFPMGVGSGATHCAQEESTVVIRFEDDTSE